MRLATPDRMRLSAVITALSLLASALLPAMARAQEGQMNPKVWFNTINERRWPFDYNCAENALQSPITVTGGAADEEPSGRIEQYSLQLDWGDGTVEPASATFVPPSGQGGFMATWNAGPHAYATGGSKTVTVTLYHSQLSGQDNIKVGSSSATICIAPPDADKDGIDDRWETANGLSSSDPSDAARDDDNDGVYNLDEYEKGGDPSKADSDDDGMPDKWEFDNQLDMAKNDATLDPDGDGRDNLTEFKDGSDPNKADQAAGWLQKNGPFLAVLALIGVLAAIILRKRPTAKTGAPAQPTKTA